MVYKQKPVCTGFTLSHTVNITILPSCTITALTQNVCQQLGVFRESPQWFCWNRFIVMLAGCFQELQQALCINWNEKWVPLPYNVCTHPSFQWRVCIYSKEKGSLISIVGLASSRDSRSSLTMFKNKRKRIKTTTNQENKKLTRCMSLSKFEEHAFKVKDCRMLINSYCLRWWRGKNSLAFISTQKVFWENRNSGYLPPKCLWSSEMNQESSNVHYLDKDT